MLIVPTSKIILLKNPIEIDYENELTFASRQAQYEYFYNLPKLECENATYQRKDEVVRFPTNDNTNITFEDLLEYNYCMYQNNAFDNKWFYAFVKKVTFDNPGMSYVELETDVFQTWYFDITFKNSFIEREHVNNDSVGLHTIPEGLETGEYIINEKDSEIFNETCFLMNISETVSGEKLLATNVNGIWMAGGFYVFDNITNMVSVITGYSKEDVIKGIWIVPKFLLVTDSYNTRWNGFATPVHYTKNVSKQTTLNGYTPINKKLLCYPYNYLLETNNNGSSTILYYEKFNSNDCVFSIGGCATIGCSIISIPQNYKGNNPNETEMLIAGKFPTCNWSEDAYTNWLTLNGVNIGGMTLNATEAGYAYGGLTTALGLASIMGGNPYGVGSVFTGVGAIMNTMQENYRHSLIPDSFKGNINGGDYLTASNRNGFYFYKMSITQEYAKIIDKYFSMYGYKVNDVKTPNITGRTNWNYVKTIGCNIVGDVPQDDMQKIKDIFNNGVTLWHNPNTFLDYSQSNNIV